MERLLFRYSLSKRQLHLHLRVNVSDEPPSTREDSDRFSPCNSSMDVWDSWLRQQLSALREQSLLRSLRELETVECDAAIEPSHAVQFSIHRGSWQRAAVEVELREEDYQRWLNEGNSHEGGDGIIGVTASDRVGEEGKAVMESWRKDVIPAGELEACKQDGNEVAGSGKKRRLLLFSGNDYLGLSCHPQIRDAAARVRRTTQSTGE